MLYRGVLVTPEGERYGHLITEEMMFEEGRQEKADFVITPTFFNAHTHLGDAALKEAPHADLLSLVGPGGFKHKMLSKKGVSELRDAVIAEVKRSRGEGTSHFLDFREGGREGVAVTSGIEGVLTLARPESVEEAESLDVYGFAYSSIRDHDVELIEGVREVARKKNVRFAIHAGERDCDDVDAAIALEPDLIVHMNMCPEKIGQAMECEIPVVSCLRSNAFFDLLNVKSYRLLRDYELWLLGTDNAMISTASMLDEMHFASYILHDDVAVLRAATAGYRIFDVEPGYVVFSTNHSFKNTRNFTSTLVRRASAGDIVDVILP